MPLPAEKRVHYQRELTFADTRCLEGRPDSSTGAIDLRIAYLINQYPKVSHTFIRREIHALERTGIAVERFALRGWSGELADPEDNNERHKTRYLLQTGAVPLAWAALRGAVRKPAAFWHAFRLAVKMGRRADRPLLWHLIYLAEACLLTEWLQTAKVDHLHAHFGTNPAEVAMLVQALGGPGYSFTVHGPEEFDKPEFLGLAEKIGRARFVIAISSFGRSQLCRWVTQSHWNKVAVVHCGLEAAFHAAVTTSTPAARRLVCVGRLCEQKAQLLLVEAARHLLDAGQEFELVLAGDGEMRTVIEQRIHALGLTSTVRITGWISSDEVRAEILAARALVLPSFAEGLPVVLMEAMSLRRPVITTYVAGIPELVTPPDNGWLVPAGDVDSLATAMSECLAAEAATLAEMGERARQRVLARHDADTEAAKLATLFQHHAVSASRT